MNNKLPLCLDSLWKSSLSPLSRSSSSSSSSSDDLWARRDVEKRADSGLSGLGEASYRPTPLTSSLCAYSFSSFKPFRSSRSSRHGDYIDFLSVA